ncbi:Uncharacterised protein [Acholeplasma oculi]|uniref:Uncharacterized protein n=1 Tax=Acholeplasma oculi TaxID=35623 RepID=A0A061AHJ5_9MOLU|nr:hypothetical protein [Acholeplasma oculi]CDR31081.1 hypothetical protein Aocu_10080 [Acholeplasma oculi]SKC36875.1 hypothetical protein SAMN02745122_0439 [Acholeplasma oculi]SUT90720.1 Uncharacterised protein [Acholeplasma oculi]
MLPKHQPQSKFGKWLLKYRLKLFLFIFIIVVPVTFIIALYLGDYLKYKNVDFGNDIQSNFLSSYITYEDETNHEIINLETPDLIVQVKLISFHIPEFYDETNGHYTIRAKYKTKNNVHIHGFETVFLLQTDWMNAKSEPLNMALTENFSTNRMISFNHILPHQPLWFVEVQKPNLYSKITYHIELAMDQEVTVNYYFRTDLLGLTPSTVIDENNA